MKPTKVRAAAVQLSPVLFSRDGTTEKVCRAIEDAAGRGASLVVFPETVVPYYPYFSFILPPAGMGKAHLELYEQAVVVPGPTVDAVSEAARRRGVVVALGVNERDHGTLYNTQLLFDADGTLVQRRRKITPTYHERMVWGQGQGDGLRAVDTAVGRVGQLACWEHYNPLARYALMADREQIHVGMFPGSMVGQIFADQIEVTIRHHALESGCFVVNATGYLAPEQRARIAQGTTARIRADRRLLHRDRVPRGGAPRASAHRRRGHGRRRPGHGAHHEEEAHDGQRRALQPARAPHSPRRSHAAHPTGRATARAAAASHRRGRVPWRRRRCRCSGHRVAPSRS